MQRLNHFRYAFAETVPENKYRTERSIDAHVYGGFFFFQVGQFNGFQWVYYKRLCSDLYLLLIE